MFTFTTLDDNKGVVLCSCTEKVAALQRQHKAAEGTSFSLRTKPGREVRADLQTPFPETPPRNRLEPESSYSEYTFLIYILRVYIIWAGARPGVPEGPQLREPRPGGGLGGGARGPALHGASATSRLYLGYISARPLPLPRPLKLRVPLRSHLR